MSKKIYLKLNTSEGIITIPFKDIEYADDFTVRYENMGDLINSLIEILRLEIDMYDVSEIYLSSTEKIIENETKLPIKYSRDNFNYESLYEELIKYFKQDRARLWAENTKFIRTKVGNKLHDNGTLDNYEIELLIGAFLGIHGHPETGYKRKRDSYFLIKDIPDIKVKIDGIKPISIKWNSDLSVYSNEKEDFLNHLIELSQREPEKFSSIMEDIAKEDLENLSELLKYNGRGIVDGVSEAKTEAEQLLEKATGLSLKAIRKKGSR